MADRTGSSYPYMGLAKDFGLPYGAVLLYADAETAKALTPWHKTARRTVDETLTAERRAVFDAAVSAQIGWMAAQLAG